MRPILYILIVVAAILVWFLLSSLYHPIGRIGHKVWKDAVDEMSRVDEVENKNKKEF